MLSTTNGQLLEKVIVNNDFSGLTPFEKVTHIKNVCESLGLNPLTKPIQLLKFQGKEIAYFTKDATEQLRKNNKISITRVDKELIDGIYIVTAYAETPEARKDASTGAVNIVGLKGEALCNAMLKAETKAKRRVTLSICGLGFIDESEVESLNTAKKINIEEVKQEPEIDETLRMDAIALVQEAVDVNDLREKYAQAIIFLKDDIEGKKMINIETNKIKNKLITKNHNQETGEVS